MGRARVDQLNIMFVSSTLIKIILVSGRRCFPDTRNTTLFICSESLANAGMDSKIRAVIIIKHVLNYADIHLIVSSMIP